MLLATVTQNGGSNQVNISGCITFAPVAVVVLIGLWLILKAGFVIYRCCFVEYVLI